MQCEKENEIKGNKHNCGKEMVISLLLQIFCFSTIEIYPLLATVPNMATKYLALFPENELTTHIFNDNFS